MSMSKPPKRMHLIGEAVPVSALLAAVVISTWEGPGVPDGECRGTSCVREMRDPLTGVSAGGRELGWRGEAARELVLPPAARPGRLITRLPDVPGRLAKVPPSLSSAAFCARWKRSVSCGVGL